MSLPPAFEDRSPGAQIVGLVGPVALAGGFLGGMEHRGGDQGLVRGAI
jgi:hypothetical protein